MSQSSPTFNDSPSAEKSFPWGCLLGGCATVLLLIVVGVLATGYASYRFVRGQIETYTSTEPVAIPVVQYTEEQIAAAKKRIDDFKAALDKGEDQEPLVLTADDINAMISSEKELAGKLFVKIDEGEISGEASFPTDAIPFVGKGRYFNGSVSLKASLENGVLIVTLDDATVNGKAVPEEVMTAMRSENLAKDAYKDPDSAAFLRKFESLVIDDDRIILKPAKNRKPDSGESTSGTNNAEAANGTLAPATPTDSGGDAQAEITDNPDFKPSDKN